MNSSMIGYLSGLTDKSSMKPTPIVILCINIRSHYPSAVYIIKYIEYKHIGTTPYFWFFLYFS